MRVQENKHLPRVANVPIITDFVFNVLVSLP